MAIAGWVMYLLSFSSLRRWSASHTVAACSEKPGWLGEQGGNLPVPGQAAGIQGQRLTACMWPHGDAVMDRCAQALIKAGARFEVEPGVIRVTNQQTLTLERVSA